MQTATVNDTTLAYERHGEGEPVVLLHPGFVANAFAPLMREPSLAGHELIAYHRRGYGESAPRAGTVRDRTARSRLSGADGSFGGHTRALCRPLIRRRCGVGGSSPSARAGAQSGAA